MASKKSQTIPKQIKITLTNENYEKLQQSATKNYRTISQEINYRLNQLLSRPGGLDAPTNPIIYGPGIRSIPDQFIPHNTPGGITTPPITTIPSPENPDGRPIVTATAGLSQPKNKTLTFTTGETKFAQDFRNTDNKNN